MPWSVIYLLKKAENALVSNLSIIVNCFFNVLQCLQLLQSVTYNCRFPVALSHIDNLVKFLVSQM